MATLGRDRREEARRRWQFRFDTLTNLSTALEDWRYANQMLNSGAKVVAAQERARVLTYRVHDLGLRELLERLFETERGAWDEAHGAAMQRLGAALREL